MLPSYARRPLQAMGRNHLTCQSRTSDLRCMACTWPLTALVSGSAKGNIPACGFDLKARMLAVIDCGTHPCVRANWPAFGVLTVSAHVGTVYVALHWADMV